MELIAASLDIGTHTARLLIAYLKEGRLIPVLTRRTVTKLGFYLKRGQMTSEGIEKLVEVLKDYKQDIQTYKVKDYRAVGTAVLRKAINSDFITRTIKEKTGIKIDVIDGETEAFLMAKGVMSTLDLTPESVLIADIGGGSTELVCLGQGAFYKSLPLGASWITQAFLKSDPPLSEEIETAYNTAKDVITRELSFYQPLATLIGTAGTVSTLAAIDLEMHVYQPALINGHRLTLSRIKEIFNLLASRPAVDRLKITGLERGREQIILGGTIIVMALLDVFAQDELLVSEGGLLEGILVDFLEQKTGEKGLKFIFLRAGRPQQLREGMKARR